MKFLHCCIFFFCMSSVYPSDNQSTSDIQFYDHIQVLYDWSVEADKSTQVTETDFKGKKPYFKVSSQDGFIRTIEYFDQWGNPAHTLFDVYHHVYFCKAVADYNPGQGHPVLRIKKLSLYDFQGVLTGYVLYDWDNKHIRGLDGNIRHSRLFKYSYTYPKGFYLVEKRDFIFGGGGLGKNIGDVFYSKGAGYPDYLHEIYSSDGVVKEERTNPQNQKESVKEYTYRGGHVKSSLIYDDKGVRIQ